MKKIFQTGLLVLLMTVLLFSLTACEEGRSVKRTYLTEDLHIMVEYSDGSSEDLGYVGVEVVPPLFEVTFEDADGNVLSVQKVYRGQAAVPPTAPDIPNQMFDHWDGDYEDIEADVTLRPIYAAEKAFTVTFKDDDGSVLSTQSVIGGHAAVPPAVAPKGDKVFDKWSGSYDNVRSDLTLEASYRAKKTFTVTFMDYSGLVLSTASVKETENAKAPANPVRDGYTFKGWSASLNNITANKTVVAQYDMKGGNNLIDIAYTINANKTITVVLSVKGTVKFCGLDAEFKVPSGLTYQSLVAGGDAVVNYNGGSVYVSVAKSSNITAPTVLATVTFAYTSAKEVILDGVVTSMTDQGGANVPNTVIGEKITLAK